jgi:outer membrane protein TolC
VLRYDQGLATHLEVSEARLGLLMARTNYAQAVAQYHIADAGLQRALGASSTALSTVR